MLLNICKARTFSLLLVEFPTEVYKGFAFKTITHLISALNVILYIKKRVFSKAHLFPCFCSVI